MTTTHVKNMTRQLSNKLSIVIGKGIGRDVPKHGHTEYTNSPTQSPQHVAGRLTHPNMLQEGVHSHEQCLELMCEGVASITHHQQLLHLDDVFSLLFQQLPHPFILDRWNYTPITSHPRYHLSLPSLPSPLPPIPPIPISSPPSSCVSSSSGAVPRPHPPLCADLQVVAVEGAHCARTLHHCEWTP